MRHSRIFAVLGAIGLSACSNSLGPGNTGLIAPSFWLLISIESGGTTVDATTLTRAPTMNFGNLSGSRTDIEGFGGCNTFGAEATLGKSTVTVGQFSSTEIGCQPSIQAIEQPYFEILTGAVRFETDIDDLRDDPSFSPPGPTLIIESANGDRLVFEGATL